MLSFFVNVVIFFGKIYSSSGSQRVKYCRTSQVAKINRRSQRKGHYSEKERSQRFKHCKTSKVTKIDRWSTRKGHESGKKGHHGLSIVRQVRSPRQTDGQRGKATRVKRFPEKESPATAYLFSDYANVNEFSPL